MKHWKWLFIYSKLAPIFPGHHGCGRRRRGGQRGAGGAAEGAEAPGAAAQLAGTREASQQPGAADGPLGSI